VTDDIRANVSRRESGCVRRGADLGEVAAPLEERWVKVESSLILLSKRVGEICNKQKQLFTRAVLANEVMEFDERGLAKKFKME
jgi:hypothetical protein